MRVAARMRPRIAVLDDYTDATRSLVDWSAVEARCDLDIINRPIRGTELATRLAPYDALLAIRERTAFPQGLLQQLPNLKLLVTFGRLNRVIDYEAASRLGIAVEGTASSSLSSTVELTWALILALSRQVVRDDRVMRSGGWQTGLATELANKVLGIVGLGKLGSEVARVASAFGMRVLAWSPRLTVERATKVGAVATSLDDLLCRADVVTLHIVLSEQTRGIIGAPELALMKSSAYLVNTSRGPLVNRAALIEALRNSAIAGAGLDVYDEEPLSHDDPLRSLGNTVLSPHMGFVTEEGYRAHLEGAVKVFSAWLDQQAHGR